ncbi:hypothetical protein TNCV_1316091 [Trichonephila clavipes]|nr:hypothetical protein TNCV_1316091 [Trichonephila clavipes]
MLYKNETTKITASWDAWIMTKSVDSAAAFVGYSRCHMPRHRIKEALDVSLGCISPHGFHILPKIFPGYTKQRFVYPGPVVVQAWTTYFQLEMYRKINQATRKQFNLIGRELLNIACHVWSRIILLRNVWWQVLNVW